MPSRDPVAPVSDFDRRLAEAFRDGLDLPADTDVTALAFEQHEHWDSLGHISLVAALEESFGTALDETDVQEITSYAAAAERLRTRHPDGS
ncbi:acyl carrier protein [Streptomyces cucumeris]|uniref:acyl carrier protein n=1 Tax=Streptomyces cucumeris TaxID=2962890 RepID=UPI003D72207C